MSAEVTIRPYREEDDASQVRELFIIVNRLLSPPHMRDAFEAYIVRSLSEEMDRVAAYYGERGGGFWVTLREKKIVGMFGLEPAAPDAMELRRMYVDPSARRSSMASGAAGSRPNMPTIFFSLSVTQNPPPRSP